MDYAWTCQCCGKQFNSLPLDFAFHSPDNWNAIPDAERKTRSKRNDDLCIIDDTDRFIRGCLEVPILGYKEVFVWGVWVSASQKSFQRVIELWDADELDDEPSFFGWFANNISIYPNTLNLKSNVILRGGNLRPLIELEPTGHPLAVDQHKGIALARVQEIVTALMPRH